MNVRVYVKTDFTPMNRLEAALPRRLEGSVRDAGTAVINDIRSHWSPTSPSARGSAPAVVTGELDASIHLEPAGRDALGRFASAENAVGVLIKVDAPHGGILESDYLDRPFLEPAVERMSPMFPNFFERVLRL